VGSAAASIIASFTTSTAAKYPNAETLKANIWQPEMILPQPPAIPIIPIPLLFKAPIIPVTRVP
jgi:hypothetical protein